MIVYPIWTTSHKSHQVVGIRHAAGLPWQPRLPVQSGQSFSRLRGCPQGSRTSTSSDALPRSGPLREPITQWDSAQNGYFDVPSIIGNTFQRRVLLKCIEWERTGEHPISVPLMKPPATAFQACTIYNMFWPTYLSNCQLLLFCLFYDV